MINYINQTTTVFGVSFVSGIQPIIPQNELLTLLAAQFGRPVTNIIPLEGGQMARVFSFTAGETAFIIRFAPPDLDYMLAKERFILEEMLPAGIPIPRIIKMGQWNGLDFMVMEKVPGQHLKQMPHVDRVRLVPEQLIILHSIHMVDVRSYAGHGHFDAHGQGDWASWRAYLASVRENETDGGFFGYWHHLFSETFLEEALFQNLYARMANLLPYCPETRFFVHGDYGFSNVMVKDDTITAVLDWTNAKYGDFLFDVAWLDLWLVDGLVKEQARPIYATAGFPLNHFMERILCYQLYIALDSFKFYAKTNQPKAYAFAQWRITQIINAYGGMSK